MDAGDREDAERLAEAIRRRKERQQQQGADATGKANGEDKGGQAEAKPQRPEPQWPEPLADEAYHGITGEIVRRLEPHTEADPVAILTQVLVAAGNILGDKGYVLVEADRHPPRLFAIQVGRTSKGRKGTSWGHVKSLLGSA